MGLTPLFAPPNTVECVLLIARNSPTAARPPARGGTLTETAVVLVVVARPTDVGALLGEVARETRGCMAGMTVVAAAALGVDGRQRSGADGWVDRLVLLQKDREAGSLHAAGGLRYRRAVVVAPRRVNMSAAAAVRGQEGGAVGGGGGEGRTAPVLYQGESSAEAVVVMPRSEAELRPLLILVSHLTQFNRRLLSMLPLASTQYD